MNSGFVEIASALRSWTTARPHLPEHASPIARRVVTALYGERDLRPADTAGLLRHLLRHEDESREGVHALLVPTESDGSREWPDRELWRRSGVEPYRTGDRYRISAKSWIPAWLDGETAPAADAFKETRRRHLHPTPGDPLLDHWYGYEAYTTPGQKQAVRGAVYAAPGSTICCILPTGSGKSLIAHLPALMAAERRGGVSLVVVPTVALALDQERSLLHTAVHRGFRHRLPDRLAYHSGLSTEEKKDLRDRVRQGAQPILFLSPEALLTTFLDAVYNVTADGRLNYLVVDEAHLVTQWGDDFRPEFQSLAGLRRDLLRESPLSSRFRTILMTATLTAEGIETLHALYGDPMKFHVVAGIQIRPEPLFHGARFSERQEWMIALREAVAHVPRPLIVYTTLVEQAKAVHADLSNMGYQRLGLIHGKTPADARERTIRQWDAMEVDIVVATSAFGVGVNNPHVRTVIHACVPENLDRFYQEVGRGGRDGRTSLSILLWTPEDVEDARGMSSPTLITPELGFERWKTMFVHKRRSADRSSDDVFDVPVSVAPPHLTYEGRRNESWNVRTLNLMARAGLVELDWSHDAPSAGSENATDETSWEHLAEWRAVRLDTNFSPLDLEAWEETIDPYREASLKRGRQGFQAMQQALSKCGDQEAMRKVLHDMYRVDDLRLPGNRSVSFAPPPIGVEIAPVPEPVPPPPSKGVGLLEPWLSGTSVVGIAVPDGTWKEELLCVLEFLLSRGVQMVIDADEVLSRADRRRLFDCVRVPWFWESNVTFATPAVLTAGVVGLQWADRPVPKRRIDSLPEPALLVFPASARNADYSHLYLRDTLGVVHDSAVICNDVFF